jgi:hypothetical protein
VGRPIEEKIEVGDLVLLNDSQAQPDTSFCLVLSIKDSGKSMHLKIIHNNIVKDAILYKTCHELHEFYNEFNFFIPTHCKDPRSPNNFIITNIIQLKGE